MDYYNNDTPGYIYLEDGTLMKGVGFGAKGIRVGEIVFTTSMNGYPESLTDPSYKGQILVITHPLIGNYGVPEKNYVNGILTNFESERIQAEGLVISELTEPFKWNSKQTLHEWLLSEGIPGVYGIDTRAVVKRVRSRGVMMGIIASGVEVNDPEEYLKKKYDEMNFIQYTSPKAPIIHQGKTGDVVVVVDCGIKHGILYQLYLRGFTVVRVPCNYNVDKIMDFYPKGLLFSNGPGNPNLLTDLVKNFREIIEYNLPTLGICLGHQIATMALGGKVKKMKFGHRAINKPVIDTTTGKSYITTHNHGYAILSKQDIPIHTRVWFYNPDDGTVEGWIHEKYNIITTQFHPEARPGPWDVTWVFDKFKKMVVGDA
ncbi:carbamoyl phosphate synthase small subunit [Sulfolobus acidocaldarius SUSAZ]|nr:carbamoyl phosphate synthase small subunit [Sulfolobus acidocaldarius SUSAZ]